MRRTLITFLIIISLRVDGQPIDSIYKDAFDQLSAMLNGKDPVCFKRAVFLTENAFVDNQYSFEAYNDKIRFLADKCRKIATQSSLIYHESDKSTVDKYAAVFRLMTDTVAFYTDSINFYRTYPYRYDFDDFWGETDWEKMFVNKLLMTNAGNCHSLPFLYKILCEELGEDAYLAMAPNHIYIKQWCRKTGWYNTELTSGHFPIDAWIMASGYVHLNAVQNGVYMDTLSQKQSIAVCLTDLAKGYQRKFDRLAGPAFLIQCAELALEFYPNYVNAMLLKAEVKKMQFEKMMQDAGANYPAQIMKNTEAKELFDEMEILYTSIHNIGYRRMPKEMYSSWLAELNRQTGKYDNKEINLNTR